MSDHRARSEPTATSSDDPTKIAIACQGGGSHTAFTAGVLQTLLEEWSDSDELVGISGTSGGAFNALAVWYGLVTEGPARASDIVRAVWDDLAATTLDDRIANDWMTGLSQLRSAGFPLPAVSPYHIPGPEVGKAHLREILERYIDFEAIPDYCKATAPELVVGTVDVNRGVFETFVDDAVTVEAVLASAAVPNIFEAVEIHETLHWDGLFSQNPPIKDLIDVPPARKPTELWIIQINPQSFAGEPRTVEAITDRRNQLSGNLSLNQEVRFVEKVNEWVADGTLPSETFNHIEVRRIEMGRQLGYATKVNRDPEFLDDLQELGRERARAFLDDR